MIYEAPIRLIRYKPKNKPDHEVPQFEDVNPESAVEWYTQWLSGLEPNIEVKFIGYAPCVGEREPVRPVFRIERP